MTGIAQNTETALRQARTALDASERPVVVLTGATGGMGRVMAEDLARDKTVVALGRDEDRLAEIAGEHVLPVPCDLGDLETIEEVVSRIPRIHHLVHAAAIAPRATLEDARIADWEAMLRTNVIAAAEATRAALPALRSTGAEEDPSTVVFIGSGASRGVSANNVLYAASKHALQAVADGFRKQVSAENIRVSTVAPGPTDTPMVHWDDQYELVHPPRLIEPASVARSVRHVIDAPADTQLTEIWVRPRVEA